MTVCASCGSTDPGGKRFCGECGARLQPRGGADGGLERKVVTVLFCDLVAFTAASDGADPEDVQARLSPYHARCRQVIERFGGTVEKFIGDAVMAAFGAPSVHEDDPERAVRAGLALLEGVEQLNLEQDLGLSVRVGVATGEAVVSTGARPELGEGMLAGDVVNTAARLQSAAPVSRVLVCDQTHVATRGSIAYEGQDPVIAKGKAEPIPGWVAVTTRARIGEDLTERPMIGRDVELAQLQDSFARACRASSVQLVTIVAEPGLGKSRLVQAFADWIDSRDEAVTWRQGACPPYGDAVAFAALAEIVKAQTGILDSDPSDVAHHKLTEAVGALVHEFDLADQESWLVARLASLVGLPASDASQEELFTAWRRFLEAMAVAAPLVVVVEDLHWADPAMLGFLAHLLEWTVGLPIVIVATARPEFYDNAPAWAAEYRNATTIRLVPLDRTETAELVTSILGTRVLPSDLQAALIAKADGNPLYAKEYLTIITESTLDETRVHELAAAMPGSVRAVIAARLDTLPSEAKQLLQAAAVVGHVFWSGAVSALVSGGEVDVRARLHHLVSRDYLRPSRTSRIAGQDEYTFGHALIADVAYSELPRPERSRHHRTVADWHAASITDPETSPDAAVTAYHYGQAHAIASSSRREAASVAGLAAAAATWHTYAAQHARQADVPSALLHALSAVSLSTRVDRDRAGRLMLVGELQSVAGQGGDAERSFLEAQRVAEQSDEAVLAAHAQVSRSRVLSTLGRGKEAAALLDAAIAILEGHPAGPELVEAFLASARALSADGHEAEALAAAEIAVATTETVPDISPRIVARALEDLGMAKAWLGEPSGADDLVRGLALAEEHNLTEGVIDINDSLAGWNFFARSVAEAVGFSERAVDAAQTSGMHAQHLFVSGNYVELLVVQGRLDHAVAVAEQSASMDAGVDNARSWVALRMFWARALIVRGDLDAAYPLLAQVISKGGDAVDTRATSLLIAAEWQQQGTRGGSGTDFVEALTGLVEDAETHALFAQYLARLARVLAARGVPDLLDQVIQNTPTGFVFYDNNVLAARATLARSRGEHAQARELYDEATSAWGTYGYPLEQAHALIGAAECRRALAEPARDLLEEAREILEGIGARPLLDETERLMAEIPA